MAWALRRRKARATSIVEMAIVLTVLLALVLGVVEYGWMVLKSQQVTNAARHGARVGARIDGTSAQVRQAIDSLMEAAHLGGSGYEVTLSPADVSAIPGGQSLTVSVRVPYADISLGMPISLVPQPQALQAAVTMAKEGWSPVPPPGAEGG
jgi:Flp pilus assembly protein TadG